MEKLCRTLFFAEQFFLSRQVSVPIFDPHWYSFPPTWTLSDHEQKKCSLGDPKINAKRITFFCTFAFINMFFVQIQGRNFAILARAGPL